ncbi:hypothetical protein HOY82DRAFT_615466 [Tuber indicum]|nr:hypothetical protein HOY82DRAFT_615466 [Tuber indicum]
MIIVPGIVLMEDWFTKTDLPDDVLLGVSESGYSNDMDIEQSQAAPQTPSNTYLDDDVLPSTPKTIRSLKRYADSLQQSLGELSPTANRSLQRFLKGSLVQAQSGAQALEDLQTSKAAELARSARQKRSRRSIQKGGELYAHEARAMVVQKEQETIEKAVEKAQRIIDSAKKTAENKVKKQWKEISKQMRKAVKDRNLRLKQQKLFYREIGYFVVAFSHPVN